MGYVSKEVDSIIRDLTDPAIKMVRVQAIEKNRYRAEEMAEERILDVLIPPAKNNWGQAEQQLNLLLRVRHSAKNCAKASWTIKRLRSTHCRANGRGNYGASGHGRDDQPVAVHVPEPGRAKAESA
ncbi:hypothetical protein ACVXG7_09860 [Enterobacter hormaechei]